MSYSRRTFSGLLLGSLAVARLPGAESSIVHGVKLGAQSYSFRDRPIDAALQAYRDTGLTFAELWQGHIEPHGLGELGAIRKRFDEAGVTIRAVNYSFRDDQTDDQIQHAFDMAEAMGTDKITASSHVSLAKRIDPFARKNRVFVGMHNHSQKNPDEFARPEDFAAAMEGNSRYIGINLDIGHFTAAGYDPVRYLEQHHERIVTLHLKDRKLDQGPNVPFGEGDTKIKETLQLLKEKQWDIPAMIEYEYRGGDTVEEVTKCYRYCRKALS